MSRITVENAANSPALTANSAIHPSQLRPKSITQRSIIIQSRSTVTKLKSGQNRPAAVPLTKERILRVPPALFGFFR